MGDDDGEAPRDSGHHLGTEGAPAGVPCLPPTPTMLSRTAGSVGATRGQDQPVCSEAPPRRCLASPQAQALTSILSPWVSAAIS